LELLDNGKTRKAETLPLTSRKRLKTAKDTSTDRDDSLDILLEDDDTPNNAKPQENGKVMVSVS
jgi:hypothetical protein